MTIHYIVKCENLVDISSALLKDNKIYILVDEKEGEQQDNQQRYF